MGGQALELTDRTGNRKYRTVVNANCVCLLHNAGTEGSSLIPFHYPPHPVLADPGTFTSQVYL